MGACLLMSVAFFPALNFLVTFFSAGGKVQAKAKTGGRTRGAKKPVREPYRGGPSSLRRPRTFDEFRRCEESHRTASKDQVDFRGIPTCSAAFHLLGYLGRRRQDRANVSSFPTTSLLRKPVCDRRGTGGGRQHTSSQCAESRDDRGSLP